jgi:hypothetical protein
MRQTALLSFEGNIYHLFTETEGNSVVCGPETAVVAPGQQRRSRGHKTHCFPEVSVNKCFVILYISVKV